MLSPVWLRVGALKACTGHERADRTSQDFPGLPAGVRMCLRQWQHQRQHARNWPLSQEEALRAMPVGVRLRVGQRQRSAPGAAKQDPGVDVQVAAQLLEIGHQRLRGVVLQAAARRGGAAAALVHQHDAPVLRVEEAPAGGASTRAVSGS